MTSDFFLEEADEWRKSVTKKEYIDEMINIFNDNKKC